MTSSFLGEPSITPEAQALYDQDMADDGFVWNVTRLWAHAPAAMDKLFELMSDTVKRSGIDFRQRGVLVTAVASTLGDSYCSLSWGGKLSEASSPAIAASVLSGTDVGLTEMEGTMAGWARKVVKEPNATTPTDVQALRDVGLSDDEIFEVTAFVALRLAFSTINDALGARPDTQLVQSLPGEVIDAVTYGRSPTSKEPV
jgi:uncharacterized peroxidase-related enzyme